MYTSLMLVALSGLVSQAIVPPAPSLWRVNYVSTLEKGRNEKKPLAIFIASGPAGWDKVSKEGKLGKEANQLLEAHYLCVYVDTSKEAGKTLAESFEMKRGLVLGDRQGATQAFRHEGRLANEELEHYLQQYGTRPEVAPVVYSAPVQVQTYAPAFVPAYAPPVQMYAPTAPMFAPSFAPAMGGFSGACRT